MATLLETLSSAAGHGAPAPRIAKGGNLARIVARLPFEAYAALRGRQPALAAAAAIALLGAAPTLTAMLFDARTVNDVNVWIKPTKFFVSLAVYYATLAWAFGYLSAGARRSRAGRFVVAAPLAAGLYEMTWIVLAAVNGVPSHFNADSLLWATAYRLGGAGSLALIGAILVQGLLIARERSVSIAPALRWGIVAGALIAFGATLITASYLSVNGGHWVGGVPTDAGGLPLFGWSRTGGDLRVAHFFALHAQQAMPALGLIAVAFGRPQWRGAIAAGAAAYVGLVAFTFVQALRGVPFLG